MMHLLINLDSKAIVGKFVTFQEAEAASAEVAYDFHIVNAEKFEGCTAKDLVGFYNNLPFVAEPIERFSDRTTAIRRINEAIEKGGVTEMAKRTRSKKATAKKTGAPRGRARAWTKVEITAAGKADDVRFQREQPRFKVYEYIKKNGDVTAETLLKFGESIGLTQAQMLGAVGKLAFRKLIRLV